MFGYVEKSKADCSLLCASESYKDHELMFLLWESSRAGQFIQRFSHLNCFKKSKHKPLGQWCVCSLKIVSSLESPTDLENRVYLKQAG